MDWSLPGSSVHRIFQARVLEQVAVPFSRGSSQPGDQTQVSCIAGGFFTDCTTRVCALNMCETYRLRRLCRAYTEKPKFSLQCFPLFTAAAKSLQSCPTLCDPMDCTCQAPPSMGFSRQDYWHGLLFPYPGDLSNSGIKPRSHALQADSLPSEPQGKLFLGVTIQLIMTMQLLSFFN